MEKLPVEAANLKI